MQLKTIAGSLLIAGALGFLVVSSLHAGTLKSIPVADLRASDLKPHNLVGQRLRMVGFVGDAPLRKQPASTPNGVISIAHLDVVQGASKVAVSYSDALPDMFRKGGPVQIDGIYVAPGGMKADHVLTKCPSKYQAGQTPTNGKAMPVVAAKSGQS